MAGQIPASAKRGHATERRREGTNRHAVPGELVVRREACCMGIGARGSTGSAGRDPDKSSYLWKAGLGK
jgi:hypothetical protein